MIARRPMNISKLFSVLFFVALILTPAARAEDFFCEVLDVEGTVTMTRGSVEPAVLQEGDLLQVDDAVKVAADSYVDISYDKDWSNVTRVEESSKIVIKAIHPTTIDLSEGGVYAKLKALPKDSTFEVKTPTAIASVRGTEYRTTVIGGETEIFNVSDSDVYVYSFDAAGTRQDTPVILTHSQKTQVAQRGHAPMAPRAMENKDFKPVERFRQGIDLKIQDNAARGKVGKIQDVKAVERFHQQGRQQGNKIFTDKDIPSNSLRSDEGARGDSSGKREPLKPMSGEDASNRVKAMTGGSQNFDQGKSVFAGEKREQAAGATAGGGKFEGRGLGQPYFPSDERARSGGPEPAGFPGDGWKSGFDEGKRSNTSDQNFEANNSRREQGNAPMNHDHEGPQNQNHGVQNNQGPQNHQPNQNQRSGGGQSKDGGQSKSGGQSKGGGRPGPRR